MKKILGVTLLMTIFISVGAMAFISVPEDTGPIYRSEKPRTDTRSTMSTVFDHPDGGPIIADAIGDTMEAHYTWGEFFINGPESGNRVDDGDDRIFVLVEMISFDHYILHAYYNFMEEFFDAGYSHASPIIRENMAATIFTRYLSDQSELVARDNVIFIVRTFAPYHSSPSVFGEDDYNIEIKMDLGNGKFSHKGQTNRYEHTSGSPGHLEDINALNYMLQYSKDSYSADFLYVDKEKLGLKFQALEREGFAENGYINIEVHLDGEYKRSIGAGESVQQPFEVGGIVRLPLGQARDYMVDIRREVYDELDYFQDIGRLRSGYDHAGTRHNTDTKYNFNYKYPIVFEDMTNRDYSLYDKYDPDQMIENYRDLQDSHPAEMEDYTWRWQQLY